MNDKNISIIKDTEGKKIVMIHDILFKGKRRVNWDDVEKYLREYIGDFYEIAETKDIIYIGKDLPDEYAHSQYSEHMKGANAKAKANAAQGLPEILEIASNKKYYQNNKAKHNKDAAFGWYRYYSRFALPVYDEIGEIIRYNVFQAVMLIRHDENGKLYLYDVIDVKKEPSTPPGQ